MNKYISQLLNYSDVFSRFAIFLVYFWFGIIKITGQSPATSLVIDLQKVTLPFFDSYSFLILLGIIEVLIGIGFLIKPLTKYVFIVAILHMGTTLLPLLFLQDISWQAFLIPTLEAQYIIKNIVLIALMITIFKEYTEKKLV